MPARRERFRQSDVVRAIKALQVAECEVRGVEVEPSGTFRVLRGSAALSDAEDIERRMREAFGEGDDWEALAGRDDQMPGPRRKR